MVEAVRVFRVSNPDGTHRDFISLADAVRHEVRIGLLAAIAGLPENATPAQEEMVEELLAGASRYYSLLGRYVEALAQEPKPDRPAAPPAPAPRPDPPARPPAAPRGSPASMPRGGSRGPGFPTRTVSPDEGMPRGAAWGDGKDE